MKFFPIVIFSLMFFTLTKGYANPMQVVLKGKAFSSNEVKVDYLFAGLAEDVIEIPNGKHYLTFQTKDDYTFIIGLEVTENATKVISHDHRAPNCSKAREVTWDAPILIENGKNGVSQLQIPEPSFGEIQEETNCVSAVMASCNPRKVVLTASSVPKEAEIWIDGKKLAQATDVTLSVPYCGYETTKQLVYRMAGKINCHRDLQLSPDAKIDASCEMKTIPSISK